VTLLSGAGSGLRGRPGLSTLVANIEGGRADFMAVLVYDDSRWVRFQDDGLEIAGVPP